MKIENISELIYALIRNEKEKISRSFETCIACEKEGNTKYRLERAFEEYKRRQGTVILKELDPAIQLLLSAPYRECGLNDLFLNDDVKRATKRMLLEWNNKDYLIQNGFSPSNKILLEGPPGNGKTSYAIALGKELNLPVLNTSSSLMLDSYLGKSEKNVTMLFTRMPENCILLFDEFEAMVSSRVSSSESAGRAWNSIVTSFLVNMETIRPSILFIAATNRTDMMDSAVIRRFNVRIKFNNPSETEKNAYVEQYLTGNQLNPDDFLFEQKSIKTAVSYADLERIMRNRHKELVIQKLLEGKDGKND